MCILLLNIILMVLISLIYLIFKIFYGKILKKRYLYFMEKMFKKKDICIYLFGFKNKVIYMAFLFQNILNK